jgi:hypothetical protein
MAILPEMVMLVPEFPELLHDLIVPADLLVNGKEQRVKREDEPDNKS